MTYTVQIPKRVEKEIAALPTAQIPKIIAAIRALGSNPHPPKSKKLEDSEDWRIRVGDYRVIYEIHETILIVKVVRVGHRKDVYRKR